MTLNDVAREAGVSKSTVSLVVNNSPKVKETTRLKVEEAIRKLGYTPNIAAKELTTNKKMAIGIIITNPFEMSNRTTFDMMDDNYFHDVERGILKAIENEDYGLLIEQFTTNSNNPEKVPNIVKKRRIEGLFVVGGIFDPFFIKSIQEYNIPLVIMGRDYEGVDCVTTDYEYATYIGIRHLIEMGHKDILYVSGPKITPTSEMKDRGVFKALKEAGIPLRDDFYIESDFTGLGGYLAVKEAMEKRKIKPTAIFTSVDATAVGAMRYFYEKEMRIPRDISIMSYDDSLLAEYATPPLSSVHINKEQIGQMGAKLLLKRMKDCGLDRMKVTVPVHIIDRESICRI